MDMELRSYPIEVFTAHFAISGRLIPRGLPTVFLNDANYPGVTVNEAHVQPLAHGGRVGAIDVKEAYLRKEEVQVVIIREFDPDEAQLLL